MKKLIAIPATVAALLAGSSATAEADVYTIETAICSVLDIMPNQQGVEMVAAAGAEGVAKGNYTVEEFAAMMYEAVTIYCPDYYGLLMRTAERHSDKPVFVA